jgi:hypothetical protein
LKHFRTILIIGIIEILIGVITLLSTSIALLLGSNTKSFSVLVFVIGAATISTLLGVGILKFKKIAYDLLLYFSSVVLLSKMLIILDVFRLNGSLETAIPAWIKNSVSMAYHGFVIFYLKRETIKEVFHR